MYGNLDKIWQQVSALPNMYLDHSILSRLTPKYTSSIALEKYYFKYTFVYSEYALSVSTCEVYFFILQLCPPPPHLVFFHFLWRFFIWKASLRNTVCALFTGRLVLHAYIFLSLSEPMFMRKQIIQKKQDRWRWRCINKCTIV